MKKTTLFLLLFTAITSFTAAKNTSAKLQEKILSYQNQFNELSKTITITSEKPTELKAGIPEIEIDEVVLDSTIIKNGVGTLLKKRLYTYNQTGKPTTETELKWDSIKNIWINAFEYEYEHDIYGNKSLSKTYYWDVSKLNWYCSEMYERSYNSEGKLLMGADYAIGWTDFILAGKSKYEYTYDQSGKQTSAVSYYWDRTTTSWISSNKSHGSDEAS